MKRRSQKILITNEARVLRALRLEHGFSMRQAGELLGLSDSTIAHVETGRINAPKGQNLHRFLKAYGGIKEKSFYQRVRTYEQKVKPQDELVDLIRRTNEKQARTLLEITRAILG